MTTLHKESKVLIALANGKSVQFRRKTPTGVWIDYLPEQHISPLYNPRDELEWRVKPDEVIKIVILKYIGGTVTADFPSETQDPSAIKLVFDSKTGNLISCKKQKTIDSIDYRQLLVKYINHVIDVDGTDFIEKISHPTSDVKFTDEEIKVLKQISSTHE